MHKKLWSKEFIAIIASSLFTVWAYYALMPTLPIYLIDTLRISNRNTGLIMAVFFISATLMRPFSGYLIDNYNRSGVLIISLLLMTVGYSIYPFIGAVLPIFLLRFMHGAMWGICTSSNAPIVADIIPPSQIGQGIGIYALTIPVGMTIGPMFGLGLLNAQGPNTMFLAIIGVSFLSLLGAFCARTPSGPVIRRRFSLPNLFSKKALPMSFCMFFIMIAYGAIIVFAGIYAAQKGFANVGTFFIYFSAAIFMSRLFAGKLFDKGHVSRLIMVGLPLTAVGVLWLGYAMNPMQFLAAGTISGFGFGILMPTCQAAVNNLVKPSERGAANSTYLTSYDLGVSVGSLIIGFLSDKVSLGEIYRYITFLVILSACIFMFKAIPHYRRNRQSG
jgi:MFS family permease